MKLSGLSGGQYQPLSDADVATLHDAALRILERTGVTYESGLEETVEMLENAGFLVDRASHRIRFPRERIIAEVRKAPRRVILCGLDPANDIDLTEHRVHLGTGGAAIKVLDLDSGAARSSTLRDIYDIGRLV
ncbi:MAG: trimethylamine methyltransferase family protein, partial [Desulfobacteraceae bacterium]|nr:trimethylamine methyltransferase family protein [Desulfobacteraceae bacterium]